VILLLGLAMTLSLRPFFEFFRPGDPYQLAAIQELEDSLSPRVLDPDAGWFQTWKQSGMTQKNVVPYFHQLDHKSGQGYRMCFTTSAAMVAAFYGLVQTQEEYTEVRARYGDTIYVKSHLQALRELGLGAEFRDDGDSALLEAEISSMRPVLVGFLHRGSLSLRDGPMCDERGCGHWAVVVGYDKDHWIMHDPMGALDVENGGHYSKEGGRYAKVPREAFNQRWQIEGPGSGWVIILDDYN
jgi:hypothetical protein